MWGKRHLEIIVRACRELLDSPPTADYSKSIKSVTQNSFSYYQLYSGFISKKFIISFVLVSAVLTVLPLSAYTFRNEISAFAEAVKPQPERFTELYFEDHTQLPKQIIDDASYDFRFTIHNLEYQTMTYPYAVYTEVDGKKQVLDRGSVTLKHDEAKTILESFRIVTPVERMKVIVELTEKKQTIHYWMGE